MYIYLVRFATIIIAVCTAYVVYGSFFKPYLYKRGITNTNTAIQIEYYTQGNTALINILPSGIWAWYNGTDVYVYGQPMSKSCGEGLQASYRIDPNPTIPKVEYSCTTKLDDLLKLYKQGKARYIFHRSDKPFEFGIQDAMNFILDKVI